MKILNSISFYILSVMAMVMVLNDNFNRYTIIGICIMIVLFMSLKDSSKESIYELLGITWLQKKFKNNPIIMDMTNE
jgi:hypothetical protein